MLTGARIPDNLHMFAPLVLENTNDAIVLIAYPPNAGMGRIVYVNAAFTAQTGYTFDEIVGRSPRDLTDDTLSAEKIAEIQAAMDQGQAVRAEITNRTKDGQQIWLDANILPLADPDGVVRHFISFRRDITEWKAREAALREARERYRTVMDACLDAFFLLEPAADPDGTLDFRVIETNKHAVHALGLRDGALIRRDRRQFDQILASPELLAGFESVARTNVPTEGLLSFPGSVWIRYNMLKIGPYIAAVTRDVSESRRSQQRIVEAEAWLRDAIESIDHGLVLYDADDCLITCNQRFRFLHDANAAALIPGATYENIIRSAITKGDWDIGAQGLEDWIADRLEQRRSKSDRSYVQELPNGRVLRIDEKRTQNGGLVAVHADITATKQRERLLQEAKEQAEAANISKSQFLATMSHELRTPLNAVIGFSEILKQGLFGELTGKNLEYVEDIHKAGRHLLALINDVLDMAKIEAGKYVLVDEAMDISELIGECIRQVAPQADTGQLTMEYDAGTDLVPVSADRRAMKQILLNLLSNAVKFTQVGGAVQISTRIEPVGLVIAIRDTGIGIAPEHIERILKPFEQAENSNSRKHEGTGLGLSITHQLTQLHGGDLKVTSHEAGGTVVTVALPAARLLPHPTTVSA